VNGVVVGSIYALIAIGFALIFATTRLFHFAHGAVYAVAAYSIFFAKDVLKQDVIVGLLLALVVAIGLGVAIELAVYRPLRRLGATPLVILIGSLGVMIFLQNFLSLVFGTESKSFGTGVIAQAFHLGPVTLTPLQVVTVLTAAVLFVLLQLYLRKTKTGKAMRAVANNPGLARIVGISADRIFLLAFAIGSALAAPAALLVSLHTGITPSMGMMAILMGAIAVIVGGLGSIPGAALGALLIGITENVGVWQIPSEWQSSIAFGLLLVFIIFRPTGFFGQKLRQAEI
jgi:branched-chain amino acid transport system permease protein